MTKEVNNLIRDFAKSDIQKAIHSYQASRGVEHLGLRGRVREIFAKQLFQSFLSNDFALGAGVIVDRFGTQSNETDSVLYCPEVIPPYLLDQATGYFPIEACVYAFEVKSKLTHSELKDTAAKFRNLDKLENLFHPQHGQISSFPITTLFAFESDLTGPVEDEFSRVRRVIEAAGPNKFGLPLIRVICVVGRGYWYFTNQMFEGKMLSGWWRVDADGEHAEVLGLIGGVINSVRGEKIRRYGLHFGQYLIANRPVTPQEAQ